MPASRARPHQSRMEHPSRNPRRLPQHLLLMHCDVVSDLKSAIGIVRVSTASATGPCIQTSKETGMRTEPVGRRQVLRGVGAAAGGVAITTHGLTSLGCSDLVAARWRRGRGLSALLVRWGSGHGGARPAEAGPGGIDGWCGVDLAHLPADLAPSVSRVHGSSRRPTTIGTRTNHCLPDPPDRH